MSSMLNQQYALTKLKAELEGKYRRKCQSCKKFGYLAYNYRNKNKKKKKLISRNKFEVLSSKVIRYGVRKEVRIRRNEMVEKVKCFRCWSVGHFKQKCPNIEVKKKRKWDKKVVYTVSLQKVQQGERPAHPLQKKAQEYSSTWRMPPRSTALEQRKQTTRQKAVTFVEYGGCNYKDTKIHKNQGQEFISSEHLRNVQCSSYLKVWRWKENSVKERGAVNVRCSQCKRKDTVKGISEEDRKKILYPECSTGRKQL